MRCSVNGNLLRGLFCRKKRVVLRQNKAYICMESIDDKIVKSVSKRGRGTIVFPANFVSLGESTSVLKALERLASKGTLIRLARGIYCYPKEDKVLGLGVIYPSYEEIAQSIAQRDKARIAPAGAYAMNVLGFTTQVPMNLVFLTDGSPRSVQLFNGHRITFKQTVPKKLSFQNKIAQLITVALQEIGQDHITDAHKQHLKKILSPLREEQISGDYPLMPAWIRTLVKGSYE